MGRFRDNICDMALQNRRAQNIVKRTNRIAISNQSLGVSTRVLKRHSGSEPEGHVMA